MNNEIEYHYYGYNDGKRGIEMKYWVVDGKLNIKLGGANSFYDYFSCLMAWPRKNINGLKFHRKWYSMAVRCLNALHYLVSGVVTSVEIRGHSMGGAVGNILAWFIKNRDIDVVSISVNAPKVGNKKAQRAFSKYVLATYDKGDAVRFLPLFYAPYVLHLLYDETKCNIIEAHNNLSENYQTFGEEISNET